MQNLVVQTKSIMVFSEVTYCQINSYHTQFLHLSDSTAFYRL